jgi:hypothetical protein
MPTLRTWKAKKWHVERRRSGLSGLLREAREAAERLGLAADSIRDLETRLTAMTDGERVAQVSPSLLINAALLIEQAKALAPELMRTDASVYAVAFKMTEDAHELMTETRNLAERAMKEKLSLLVTST